METFIIYVIVGVVLIAFGLLSGRKAKAKVARCTGFVTGSIIRINESRETGDEGYKKKKSYEPVYQFTKELTGALM